MKKSLIIGRFQPFHLGHLAALKLIDSRGPDEIIIGIGLVPEPDTRNPWSPLDVMRMISSSLEGELQTTRIKMVVMPDIGNPPKYAEHVEKLTGASECNTTLFTGNFVTKKCFQSEEFNRHYRVVDFRELGMHHQFGVSGSRIRTLIILNDDTWKTLVPRGTREFIEKRGYPQGERG